MEMKTIKVSDKGQIAIPTVIRAKMGIAAGDELLLLEVNGKILIEKAKKVSKIIEDDFKDVVKFSENSLKEVWDNKKDNIWSIYLKK